MALKSFVLFCRPLLEDRDWLRYFNASGGFASLDYDACRERILPLASDGILLHPSTEASGVKSIEAHFDRHVAQGASGRLKFYLQSAEHADYLRRVGGVNILQLPSDSISDSVLVLRWRGDERYYRRWELPFPTLSERSVPGGEATVYPYTLYLGVDRESLRETWGNHRLVELEIADSGSLSWDRCSVWLNPILLRFDSTSSQLPTAGDKAAPDSGYLAGIASAAITTRLLVRDEALLDIIPVVSNYLKARIALLESFTTALRESEGGAGSRGRSAIEEILFGTDSGNLDWRPFFCLDLLGGKFSVANDLVYGLQKMWTPPQRLSPNQLWIARKLVEQWGGTIVERAVGYRTMQPRRPKQVRNYRPALTIPGHISKTDLFGTAKQALSQMYCGEHAFPDSCTEGKLIREFVLPVLDKGLEHDDQRKMLHGPYIFEKRADEYSFDETGFLEEFSQHFLAPRSPVLFQIYSEGLGLHGESRNNFQQRTYDLNLNLIDSPFQGARKLLTKLAGNLGAPKASSLTLRNEHGWWETWYESLFTHAAAVRINFDQRTHSAELKKAKLGYFQLGATLKEYLQPPTVSV